MRSLLAVAGLLMSTSAFAAPSTAPAKAAFKQGVSAYKAGNYAAASEALEKSYKLEADSDTLFAWAQTERKLGHCDRAIEMYERLLKRDMPAANKTAINTNLGECKATIAQAKAEDDAAKAKAAPAAVDDDKPPPKVVATPDRSGSGETHEAVAPIRETPPSTGRPWWKEPVGDTLVIAGLVGVGVGGAMLMSARSLDAQANDAGQTSNYFEFQRLHDDAHSKSQIGLIAGGVGVAAIVGGIVWYATRSTKQAPVVGWTAPSGGGVAVVQTW